MPGSFHCKPESSFTASRKKVVHVQMTRRHRGYLPSEIIAIIAKHADVRTAKAIRLCSKACKYYTQPQFLRRLRTITLIFDLDHLLSLTQFCGGHGIAEAIHELQIVPAFVPVMEWNINPPFAIPDTIHEDSKLIFQDLVHRMSETLRMMPNCKTICMMGSPPAPRTNVVRYATMAAFAAVFEMLQDRRIELQTLSAIICEVAPTQHTPLEVFHMFSLPGILRNPVRDRTDWSSLTEIHLMLQVVNGYLGQEQLFAWMNCLLRLQTLKLALDDGRAGQMPAESFVHEFLRRVELCRLHTLHLRTTTTGANIVTEIGRKYGHTLKHLHLDFELPGSRALYWLAEEIQSINALLPIVETFGLSVSLQRHESHYKFCLGNFRSQAERLKRFKWMAKELEHLERTICC